MSNYISKQQIDAIRLLLLGNLYDRCASSQDVTKKDLEKHLQSIQSHGCLKQCNVNDLVGLCKLKSSKIPANHSERHKLVPACYKAEPLNVQCLKRLLSSELLARFERDYKEDESQTDNRDDMCSICYEYDRQGTSDDLPITTPCGHYFHIDCLQSWFERAKQNQQPISCPECRTTFDDEFVQAVTTNGSSLLLQTFQDGQLQPQTMRMLLQTNMQQLYNQLRTWANQSDDNRMIASGIMFLLFSLIIALIASPGSTAAVSLLGANLVYTGFRATSINEFNQQLREFATRIDREAQHMIQDYKQQKRGMRYATELIQLRVNTRTALQELLQQYNILIGAVMEDQSISASNRQDRVAKIYQKQEESAQKVARYLQPYFGY